jgi:hypothetical protein
MLGQNGAKFVAISDLPPAQVSFLVSDLDRVLRRVFQSRDTGFHYHVLAKIDTANATAIVKGTRHEGTATTTTTTATKVCAQ